MTCASCALITFRPCVIAAALFWALPLSAQAAPPPPLGQTSRVTFVSAVDGDTIDVEVRTRYRIRLLDCWAPEVRTKNAQEKQRGLMAKRYLDALIRGKQGTLFIPMTGTVADSLTLDRWLGHATKEKPK